MRRAAVCVALALAATAGAAGQSGSASRPLTNSSSRPKGAPVIQTEKIQVPAALQTPPPSMASQPGYMLPAETQRMLLKVWQLETRVRDLMTQVHPELLNMPSDQAVSLGRALEALAESLDSLETARAEFSGRVDSEYLAFQTYAAMTNLRTPLRRVANLVSRYQSRQVGGMFEQSWNDLFTLEAALEPYVAFLTRNHDRIYALMQGNLYDCQNQLTAAMRKHPPRTKMIRNIVPFKPRRPRQTTNQPKAVQKK
jgi:hypothetical protein